MTGREKKVGGWRKIWCGMVRGALRSVQEELSERDLDLASEEPAWVIPVNGKLSGAPHQGWAGNLQALQDVPVGAKGR